jgi:hypothetical protein
MNKPTIQTASVKVMRSYDYCHFEVALTIAADQSTCVSLDSVDELRKQAMRLADKAVAQYKVAKAHRETSERFYTPYEIESIKALAETDRTPEQKASLKAHQDAEFFALRDYDYEDD